MNDILKKLGFKGQSPILIMNAPESFENVSAEIPGEVHVEPAADYAFILVFAVTMEEAEGILKRAVPAFRIDGHFWLCYPKGTSKRLKSDINRNKTWELMAPFGLEPVSQVAVDEDWSAMRFKPVNAIQKMTRKTAATKEGKERIRFK